MGSTLTTKERKKAFDKIFKEKIVPFLETNGFQLYSKTTKRFFKLLPHQLSVYIYFEFKTFGSGLYDISIVYYDEELGPADGDVYLSSVSGRKPHIKATTMASLQSSVEDWIQKMQQTVIPFIETHSTHQSILQDAYQFYFSNPRQGECFELLKRKSLL